MAFSQSISTLNLYHFYAYKKISVIYHLDSHCYQAMELEMQTRAKVDVQVKDSEDNKTIREYVFHGLDGGQRSSRPFIIPNQLGDTWGRLLFRCLFSFSVTLSPHSFETITGWRK